MVIHRIVAAEPTGLKILVPVMGGHCVPSFNGKGFLVKLIIEPKSIHNLSPVISSEKVTELEKGERSQLYIAVVPCLVPYRGFKITCKNILNC